MKVRQLLILLLFLCPLLSDGDDAANMELSKNRAAAVKDALINEFSIDPAQLETEGKGETAPIADSKTKVGKALNRRVEFVKL